jgi:hypothetical protein
MPPANELEAIAAKYGKDARREHRMVVGLYAWANAMAIGAAALGIAGIIDARGRTFDFARFSAYGLVALFVLAFAVATLRQAGRHRAAEHEARRLQRQLRALDPYLSSLPSGLHALYRATLVSSLFSRLSTDEPWRDPVWPDPASVAAMVDEAPLPPSPTTPWRSRLRRLLAQAPPEQPLDNG